MDGRTRRTFKSIYHNDAESTSPGQPGPPPRPQQQRVRKEPCFDGQGPVLREDKNPCRPKHLDSRLANKPWDLEIRVHNTVNEVDVVSNTDVEAWHRNVRGVPTWQASAYDADQVPAPWRIWRVQRTAAVTLRDKSRKNSLREWTT